MNNLEYDFEDIAPFEGQAFADAVSRLKQYRQLTDNFTDILSRHSRVVNRIKSINAKREFRRLLENVHCYEDFQKQITCNLFLKMIEESSIDKLSYGGIPSEDEPHVYISNHRDIVLDTALLELCLYREGRNLCEMVIGDNLLSNQFITDMFKVNGAITVRRNLTSAAELMKETQRLSSYIRYCLEVKKKSVWIAQKSGRSKDGKDNTSPAIIKMLYLAYRNDKICFEDFIKKCSIVPVAISYQYDPCDVSKSQEEIRKLKCEGCYNVYKKKQYADILDMVRGLRHYKGNVHIQCDKPISEAKDANEAARAIDKIIHKNYRLWDTNYIAYDLLEKTDKFSAFYDASSAKKFEKKYGVLKSEVVDFIYNEYANPVRSRLNEENS